VEPKPIVVGFKTGAPGRAALEAAIAEARLRDAPLIVIHSMRGGHLGDDEIRELQDCEKALEEVDRRLTDEGIDHETQRYVRGRSPAEDLADVASTKGASLLVIGHRHRSKTGKYFLGSDTQEILLQSPCPVLAVRTDPPKA
jgi:nucleotide-binding universal stress UspA family protein